MTSVHKQMEKRKPDNDMLYFISSNLLVCKYQIKHVCYLEELTKSRFLSKPFCWRVLFVFIDFIRVFFLSLEQIKLTKKKKKIRLDSQVHYETR